MVAQRAVRGAMFTLAGSYTNMLMGAVYGIVMARLLEPEHFGIFALALFFFAIFDLRGKLGLDYAFVHRQPTTDELLATHWMLQILASFITLLWLAVLTTLFARFDYPPATAPVLLVLSSAMVIEAMGTTPRIALEKELAFARPTVIITLAFFFSYVAGISLALCGFTYWALVGQVVVNVAIGAFGFWVMYRVREHAFFRLRFDQVLARWMLRFGLVLALGSLATAVLLQFDNFLVGTLVSASALGYYALAYKVAQWPTGLVTHIVSRVSLPTYAKLQSEPRRLAKAFEMTLWLILTLATPLALALFVSAPDFLRLLYGDRWLPSAILLRALIAYSILRPIFDDTGALFTAIGQPQKITTVLVVQAVTLVTLGAPLTLAFEAFGTAIAVGVAFVVGIALMYYFVSRTIPIHLSALFTPTIFSAVASVVVYYLFANLFDLNALPLLVSVMLKGGFTVLVFLLVLYVLEHAALFERVAYVWRLVRGNL